MKFEVNFPKACASARMAMLQLLVWLILLFIGLGRFPKCYVSWFQATNILLTRRVPSSHDEKGHRESNAISERGVCKNLDHLIGLMSNLLCGN